MKPASFRHRGPLSVCLPGLLAVFPLFPRSKPPLPAVTLPIVNVHARDNPWNIQSGASPMVTEVRFALFKGLAGQPKGMSTTQSVRAVLTKLYGSRVSEETYAMYYAWEWDSVLETWVFVCNGGAEFEVKFGPRNAVMVETQDTDLVK